MATSSVMQSILVSPVAGVAKGLGSNRLSPYCRMPHQRRSSSVAVRCTAEDGQKEEAAPTATPSTPSPLPIPPLPPKAKVSTDFFDVLAFSGPAPERINGRLAMIGFMAAIAVELSKGEDLFTQISNGGIPWFLLPWFLLITGVLSAAFLIPLFSGVTMESKSKPFWSSNAEMWNGRFAMLGLVALAFTEFVKGGALIV
ncbi:early light-induced protein 1, chloroplastic-like [Rhododendron vialii]|uniref:early light-induced protein 1, chloroplastic-like n=1 Tax=Rhododendron vialii TaxID=182163 RepID=UPI00265F9F7E|nr:early light-induced protein 1, chloroplastic-like [Rhododendron vialii]